MSRNKEEERCRKIFELKGKKLGVCVGLDLKPEISGDVVSLCLTKITKKGRVITDNRCMTLDEASLLGLNLMQCQYFFNQMQEMKENV